MNDTLETNEAPAIEAEDRFSSPSKLLKIASWSYILSWVILALEVIFFIGRLYFEFLQGQSLQVVTVFNFLFYISALVGGIIWFVVLQAVSEGIYLWLDIEENSRKGKEG